MTTIMPTSIGAEYRPVGSVYAELTGDREPQPRTVAAWVRAGLQAIAGRYGSWLCTREDLLQFLRTRSHRQVLR